LNYLLSINKSYILLISFLCFVTFLLFIFLKFYNVSFKDKFIENDIISKADITEPKFAINGSNQNIVVTAREGNFVSSNKVLLKRDVKFKSSKFILETNKVIFDRKNQTAVSHTASKFNSENTEILSEGFDIYDNGSRIKFFGKATIILE
tara:strand:+ start:101 stop:550 length:450 start_codon:yes stop_codon:yes gene_type:complete